MISNSQLFERKFSLFKKKLKTAIDLSSIITVYHIIEEACEVNYFGWLNIAVQVKDFANEIGFQ